MSADPWLEWRPQNYMDKDVSLFSISQRSKRAPPWAPWSFPESSNCSFHTQPSLWLPASQPLKKWRDGSDCWEGCMLKQINTAMTPTIQWTHPYLWEEARKIHAWNEQHQHRWESCVLQVCMFLCDFIGKRCVPHGHWRLTIKADLGDIAGLIPNPCKKESQMNFLVSQCI